MRPDLETYYLIDQYLDNKLKGEELISFERKLSDDPTFAKEVAEHRMLNNFILEAELKDVRSQIEKDLANMTKPSFIRMHWQWIGLGIVSLSSILYLSTPVKKDISTQVKQAEKYSTHTATTIIETERKIENNFHTYNKTETKAPSAIQYSEIEPAKLNNTVILDSVRVTQKEILPKIVHTTNSNQTPEVLVPVVEEAKKIDCSTTKITFSLATETTCNDTQTGSITIEKISGGVAPYSYLLNNKKIKEKNISNLAAGNYEIKISDKNGCLTTNSATILEKNCTPTIQQGAKFNINPTIGETCNIPFNTDKKGNIAIFNRVGKIVYRIQNASNEFIEWSGTDGYGALVEAGLYIYMIEYSDGTKVTGEVNITR